MTVDEFNSMTLGNFSRRFNGWIRNTWVTQREIIAAIRSVLSSPVTGEDVFPFGLEIPVPEPPSDEDREMMRKRHEHTLKLING